MRALHIWNVSVKLLWLSTDLALTDSLCIRLHPQLSSWKRHKCPWSQSLWIWISLKLHLYTTPDQTTRTTRCRLMHTHIHACAKIVHLYPGFVLSSQVPDVCPLPGMVVSPSEGVIPCGGNAALSIHLKADSVIKFDTRIEVRMTWKGKWETPSLNFKERGWCKWNMFITDSIEEHEVHWG